MGSPAGTCLALLGQRALLGCSGKQETGSRVPVLKQIVRRIRQPIGHRRSHGARNGYLLDEGWTIAIRGWQRDVPDGFHGLTPPVVNVFEPGGVGDRMEYPQKGGAALVGEPRHEAATELLVSGQGLRHEPRDPTTAKPGRGRLCHSDQSSQVAGHGARTMPRGRVDSEVSTPVPFRDLSSGFAGGSSLVVTTSGCCLVASAPGGPVQQPGRGDGW